MQNYLNYVIKIKTMINKYTAYNFCKGLTSRGQGMKLFRQSLKQTSSQTAPIMDKKQKENFKNNYD